MSREFPLRSEVVPAPVRIAVVNSHPIQYFAPLYRHLNSDPGLRVSALYCTDFSLRGGHDPGFGRKVTWDVDLLSGYETVFLGERARRRVPRGFWSLVVPEIWREIRSGKYDVVWLHGYNYAAYLLAFLAAKSKGMPVLMRGETHMGLSRPGWKRALRDRVLALAYRWVDGFLAIGSANRQYYLSLGVPASQIFDVPYTVDNDRFMAASRIDPAVRSAVRVKYGLPPDRPVVLYASKLMRRKHPDDVLRAAALLSREGRHFSVLMVGTGEMDAELQALCASLGLENVVFAGFVNQAELPQVYAASDVFVLPSENEPWGLVVNEVMCAGLPVVVGAEVGCVPDLVHAGVNGLTCQPGDPASLAQALASVLHDEASRRRMAAASVELIRRWDYRACARGLRMAVNACLSAGRVHHG